MIPEPVLRMLQAISRRELTVARIELVLAALAWTLFALSLYSAAARIALGSLSAPGLAVVATVAGAIALARLRRPPLSPMEAALLVDRRLRLKDRIATALERGGESLHSALGRLMMKDAEQHARFVDPKEVVPLRKALAHRGAAAALGALSLAAALALPLPEGLFAPWPGRPALPAEVPDDPLDELLEKAEELEARASALRSPGMERFQEDLSQLRAGLRSRTVARNEALALLEFFERRIESASAAEASGSELPTESLDRLQSLAERLRLLTPVELAGAGEFAEGVRRLVRPLRETGPGSARDALEPDGAAPADEPPHQATEQAGSIRGARGLQGVEEALEPGDIQPGPVGSGSDPPGPRRGSAAPGDQGASSSLAEASAAQGGGSPGAGGRSGDPAEGSFQPRSEQLLPAAPLLGEMGDGPLRFGRFQAGLFEAEGVQEGSLLEGLAGAPVERPPLAAHEAIPLDYREPVRLYFRRLEPEG